jgi:hypothetical protein
MKEDSPYVMQQYRDDLDWLPRKGYRNRVMQPEIALPKAGQAVSKTRVVISSMIPILSLLALWCVCSSCSETTTSSAPPKVAHVQPPNPGVADTKLVDILVQAAKAEFEVGQLADADKILQAALVFEPENMKAQYYLDVVHQAIWAREQSRRRPRYWYPTIPMQPPKPFPL